MEAQVKKSLEGPIAKSLFRLAIPMVVANIFQAGYQLTDAFWVGRLGDYAVAAVSVSSPLIFLSIAMGVGFAVAGSTLISQYFGAKNYKMVNHVAVQTLLMTIIVSVLISIIGFIATPKILGLMGVASNVYDGALGFMRITFVGLVFNFFVFMFQSIMRGIGEVRLPVYIAVSTVLLNFILDPLFIFGWGFVPAFGVWGAAFATLGTQSLAAFIGFVVLLGGRYGVKLKLNDFKPDFSFIKRAFGLGLPASIEQSARAFGITAFTFLVASFGTLTVAAYGVGSNILQVVIIPSIGLSMAISTLIGHNIGAGQIDRADKIGRLGARIGFWILTGFGIFVYIFAPQIVNFFIPGDKEVIKAGAHFLRIVSFSWGFMSIQFSVSGVLRAAGKMKTVMSLAIISLWVFQFPLAYILSKYSILKVDGLWWSFVITNIVIAIISWTLYLKSGWQKVNLTKESEMRGAASREIIIEEGIDN